MTSKRFFFDVFVFIQWSYVSSRKHEQSFYHTLPLTLISLGRTNASSLEGLGLQGRVARLLCAI